VLLRTRDPLDILVLPVYLYVRCTSLSRHADYVWVVYLTGGTKMFCLDSAGSLSTSYCRFELKLYILINNLYREIKRNVLQLRMMENVS